MGGMVRIAFHEQIEKFVLTVGQLKGFTFGALHPDHPIRMRETQAKNSTGFGGDKGGAKVRKLDMKDPGQLQFTAFT